MAYKMYPVLFNGEMVRVVLEGRKTQTRRPVKPQPVPSSVGDRRWVVKTDGKPSGMSCCNATDWDVRYWCNAWCPYRVGDHLWIRETFVLEDTDEVPTDGRPYRKMEEPGEFGQLLVPHYRATESEPYIVPLDLSDSYDDRTRWCPSIHMPRWASRIALEVTDVRVQRVQEISKEDALAEGLATWMEAHGFVGDLDPHTHRLHTDFVATFGMMWDTIYAKPKPAYKDKKIMHYASYPWEAGTETRDYRGLSWFVCGNPWIWATSFKKLEGRPCAAS